MKREQKKNCIKAFSVENIICYLKRAFSQNLKLVN